MSMGDKLVVKIGGNELDDEAFIEALTAALVNLNASSATPTVIVHGGGKEIAMLQQVMGLETRFVDGLRVTDEASLAVAMQVLCGVVNKRLVSALTLAGLDALGMSGVDRGVVRAEKLIHREGDLGRVGVPVSVRGEVLEGLLDEGVLPVLAPICLGPDGPYNVNADQVASAVAAELEATLLLVTDVPGVLVDGEVVETLPQAQAESLIESGVINGGMQPKVQSALAALAAGVPAARILDLNQLGSNGGTRLAV